jgi:hypothetical protein
MLEYFSPLLALGLNTLRICPKKLPFPPSISSREQLSKSRELIPESCELNVESCELIPNSHEDTRVMHEEHILRSQTSQFTYDLWNNENLLSRQQKQISPFRKA